MLNRAQSEVVQSDAEKLLVLAGAGTGKTTTMLARISRLVDENKVDVQSILVLTFTNAAACEMRDRYRRSHHNQQTPTFCTFHSFCYSLIASNKDIANRLGYFKGTPDIADSTMLRKIHTMCKQKCSVKLSDDKLNGKVAVSKKEQFEKELYWKQYNKLLREQNLITFDIMCYEVCKLFSSNAVVIADYKKRYKYIFVYEFQDTDPKQWDFVSSFTHSNLFVCGDAKQCQPAGTLVTMLDGTKKPIENLKVGDFVLSYNRREGRFHKTAKVGYGKRVMKIARNRADSIYTVHAGDYKTMYTPNHITYARIHYSGNEDRHVVYIMCNSKG